MPDAPIAQNIQAETDIRFKDYLIKNFQSLGHDDGFVILGPTLDSGANYWRIGLTPEQETEFGLLSSEKKTGWGLATDKLTASISILKAHGIPDPTLEERQALNTLFYEALQKAQPNRKFVAKHFPGGTELLETTEQQPVHFGAEHPIAKWIDGFAPAISGKHPSWGMMLGHSSYDLSAGTFPGMQFPLEQPSMPNGLYEAIKKATGRGDGASVQEVFSYVPASMNPFITDYLRTNKGYKGILVGDWYDMGAVTQFTDSVAENWHPVGISAQPTGNDIAFIMATNAGIQYIRPLNMTDSMNQNFWKAWSEQDEHKNYIHADFESFDQKLNKNIFTAYNKLKNKNDPAVTMEDLKKISLYDKLHLVANDVLEMPLTAIIANQSPDIKANDRTKYKKALDHSRQDFIDETKNFITTEKSQSLFRVLNQDNQITQNDFDQRGAPMMVQYKAFRFSVETGQAMPLEIKLKDTHQLDDSQTLIKFYTPVLQRGGHRSRLSPSVSAPDKGGLPSQPIHPSH